MSHNLVFKKKKEALLEEGVQIVAGEVFIEEQVEIAKGVKIYPNVFIGDNVAIMDGTTIFAGAKIYSESQIGKNCTIHSGVIIGCDGFGFVPDENGVYKKVPQIGNVILEDKRLLGYQLNAQQMGFLLIYQCDRVNLSTSNT